MDKELLMLHGALHAVATLLEKGNCGYAKKGCGYVEYTDICDYLMEKIEELESERED